MPVTLDFDYRGNTGVIQHATMFAVIPAQTPPPPGAYTDTIVVTVSF